jgi:CheY-like chemotaxis protein
MMPEMDGQEATRAIRALGGSFAELPIAALTANAVAGMREKFLENGFNDFLAKPIDTALLDAVLRKWIPDAKQRSVPEGGESAPYEAGETLPAIEGLDMAAGIARIGGAPGRYRELLRVFLTDVEARFGLLEASPDAAGLPAFIIAVHALKSALANIGANALSESAAGLELAGRNGDLALIGGKLASFREGLAALAARIGEALAEADGAGLETAPAPLYLEALAGLQAALEARDTDGLDAALAQLQSLHLAPERREAVAGIARHVLFGDFKKALEAVNALL